MIVMSLHDDRMTKLQQFHTLIQIIENRGLKLCHFKIMPLWNEIHPIMSSFSRVYKTYIPLGEVGVCDKNTADSCAHVISCHSFFFWFFLIKEHQFMNIIDIRDILDYCKPTLYKTTLLYTARVQQYCNQYKNCKCKTTWNVH